MLNKAWGKFLALFKNEEIKTLGDILRISKNRDSFLGIETILPRRDNEVKVSAAKVIRYAQSEDYSVWVENAWEQILEIMDKLMSPNLSNNQSDYLRGALTQTMKMIRISHEAHQALQREKNKNLEKELASSI